jgi:hypothetical protein
MPCLLAFNAHLQCIHSRSSLLPLQISLLRVTPLGVLSVADLVANVEAVPGSGDVLMVRLYEGQAAAELGLAGKSTDPKQRLETLLSACIDVPQIMATMPEAIKRAVALAR